MLRTKQSRLGSDIYWLSHLFSDQKVGHKYLLKMITEWVENDSCTLAETKFKLNDGCSTVSNSTYWESSYRSLKTVRKLLQILRFVRVVQERKHSQMLRFLKSCTGFESYKKSLAGDLKVCKEVYKSLKAVIDFFKNRIKVCKALCRSSKVVWKPLQGILRLAKSCTGVWMQSEKFMKIFRFVKTCVSVWQL